MYLGQQPLYAYIDHCDELHVLPALTSKKRHMLSPEGICAPRQSLHRLAASLVLYSLSEQVCWDVIHLSGHRMMEPLLRAQQASMGDQSLIWPADKALITVRRKAQGAKKMGVRASLAKKLLSKRATKRAAYDLSAHESEAHAELNTNRWEEK